MLYTSLLVAAAAFSGLVSAQNNTGLPPSIGACCDVDPGTIPANLKSDWCQAETNTCPNICGGDGEIAQGGLDCDETTLEYTCKCKNGTEPDMTLYQQSVPAQMCLYWYGQCINATNENKQQQLACVAERDSRCGNLTIDDQGAVSTTTREGSPTSTGGGGGSSGTAGAATGTGAPSESSGAAIALHVARDYGTPILGAGIMAIFGLAL